MNSSNFRFTLDMHSTQSQISIPVLHGDTSRSLCINLSNGEDSYVIEDGCIATFVAKKPDGTTIFNSCVIEKNKTIVYDFTEQTTNVEGIVKCEMRLYGTDGKEITSPRFILVVDARVINDDDIALSENEYTAIGGILIAEADRELAESERKMRENGRITAETGRHNAENERKEAENSRKAGEAKRVGQEIKREEAEAKRQEAFDNAVDTAVATATDAASVVFQEAAETIRNEYVGFFGTVSLLAENWENMLHTVSIPDVGENDYIMFFPATYEDNLLISENKIFCAPESEEGEVIFTAESVPTATLNLKYLVTRRGEG